MCWIDCWAVSQLKWRKCTEGLTEKGHAAQYHTHMTYSTPSSGRCCRV